MRRVGQGGSALDPEIVSRLFDRRRSGSLEMLSQREREVLGLMAEGRSNHGIATVLVVTEDAVGKDFGSILRKLDIAPGADTNRRVFAVLTYLRS